MAIPIIDIFAGPGGLSEGFSSVLIDNKRVFDVRLSIEMDENAHKTLELRSFFRKFPIGKVPIEYYEMLMEADLNNREKLRELLFEKYNKEASEAKKDAWRCTLGGEDFPPDLVKERINRALNGAKDWVLIGGPPCQAYSLVGRSRRQLKDNLDGEDHRVHLYKEYLRIIADHHPAVFVMENVKGLLSSKLNGESVFLNILSDLKNPGSVFKKRQAPKYRIYSLTVNPIYQDIKGNPIYEKNSDFLIKSEQYGVPQKRHRVILLGIRIDIETIPEILKKNDNYVSLSSVIGDLPKIRSGISKSFVKSEMVNGKKKRIYSKVPNTNQNWAEIISSFKHEIISWNGFDKDNSNNSISIPEHGTGAEFLPFNTPSKKNPLYNWYNDPNIKGAVNHESRAHLVQDLKRYMFSSMFTKSFNRFPRLHEYEGHSKELLPEHENAKSGKFEDRFRVQVPDQPATTVTSHISKDGHYFIHYDPEQCRSLTVREAARIQTFPDNYLFCGGRTAQYHQVGNAVPPYLAKQIGEVVLNVLGKWK